MLKDFIIAKIGKGQHESKNLGAIYLDPIWN